MQKEAWLVEPIFPEMFLNTMDMCSVQMVFNLGFYLYNLNSMGTYLESQWISSSCQPHSLLLRLRN